MKKIKKLSLNLETIRVLKTESLSRVAGGISMNQCHTIACPSQPTNCICTESCFCDTLTHYASCPFCA